jgi:hypothetical protein
MPGDGIVQAVGNEAEGKGDDIGALRAGDHAAVVVDVGFDEGVADVVKSLSYLAASSLLPRIAADLATICAEWAK